MNDEKYAPITYELRKRLATVMIGLPEHTVRNIETACDAIDSIHESLERENEALRKAFGGEGE